MITQTRPAPEHLHTTISSSLLGLPDPNILINFPVCGSQLSGLQDHLTLPRDPLQPKVTLKPRPYIFWTPIFIWMNFTQLFNSFVSVVSLRLQKLLSSWPATWTTALQLWMHPPTHLLPASHGNWMDNSSLLLLHVLPRGQHCCEYFSYRFPTTTWCLWNWRNVSWSMILLWWVK